MTKKAPPSKGKYTAIGLPEESLPDECEQPDSMDEQVVDEQVVNRRVDEQVVSIETNSEVGPACNRKKNVEHGSKSFLSFPCLGALILFAGAIVCSALSYNIGHSRGMQSVAHAGAHGGAHGGNTKQADGGAHDGGFLVKKPHLSSYHFLNTPRAKNLTMQLQNVYLTDGAAKMLLDSNKLLEHDAEWSASCHPMLHGIGNWARQRHNVTKSFTDFIANGKGTPQSWLLRVCNGAYLHGVCESFIKESDDMEPAVTYIAEYVCEPLRNSPPAPAGIALGPPLGWECNHGIGHGILQNLRRKAKKTSLVETVKKSSPGSILQTMLEKHTRKRYWGSSQSQDFVNGMWMEHFADMSFVDHALPQEPEHALKACDEISGHAFADMWACNVYAPTAYLLIRPRAYAGALDWCREGAKKLYGRANVVDEEGKTSSLASNVTDAAMQRKADSLVTYCTVGVGTQARKENMLELPAVEAACKEAATLRLRRECWQGAMNYWPLLPGQTCADIQDVSFRDQCNKRTR